MTEATQDSDNVIGEMRNFTRVANDVWEPVFTGKLTLVGVRVFLSVVRGTLGWNRWWMPLQPSKLARRLNVARSNVYEALKTLQEQNLIVVRRTAEVSGIKDKSSDRVSCRQDKVVSLAGHLLARSVLPAGRPSSIYRQEDKDRGKDSTPQSQPVSSGEPDPHRPVTQDDLKQCLRDLASTLVIPKPLGGALNDRLCAGYWSALGNRGWSVQRLRELCRIAQQTCRFFPAPSEILDIANDNPSAGRPLKLLTELPPDEEPVSEEEFERNMAEIKRKLNIA